MSISSAEVAADFKDALQDLKVNSRPEISNLTIIAKENTEHAQAISHELEDHIRTTRPEWKLPALYVLDSIVKNVGTPYTVYLGRNLYRTFMGAYSLMDQANRRAMDALIKTWKQPVPESMDTRPVFPPEVTRDIESALIKMRTAHVQTQQQARPPHGLPPRPVTNPMANAPWRDTPTPPQNIPRYAAPNDPRVRQPYLPAQQHGQFPPSATPPMHFPPAQPYPQPVSSSDLENLKAELAKIITTTKTTWALYPEDPQVQPKLKALLDLQTVLTTQTIPPQQLQAIRAQLQQLAPPPPFGLPASATPPQQATAPNFPPASAPMNLAQFLANVQLPLTQTSTPANATPSLADMLRRVSSPAQPSSTPTTMPFFPPPFSVVPQPTPAPAPAPVSTPTPTNNLAALLANLGKTPAASTVAPPPLPQATPLSLLFSQQPPAPSVPPVMGSAEWLLNALKGLPNAPAAGTPILPTPLASEPMTRQVSATANAQNDVELTTASMKKPRLHLISRLYEAVPNICNTCGRRFESTPQGKEKKARHMDWHFKVKDPDAAKRGIHRSWYISEKEWIEYREVDETSPDQAANEAKAAAATKKETKDKYVPAPSDPLLARAPCPICQEEFKPEWNVAANDFVFMDAVKVNGKIYHATCWEEYSRGSGIMAPSTPDSVLGKRKAEVSSPASGKKIRAY